MNDPGGIDLLASLMAEANAVAYREAYATLTERGMSPIEALFLLAFISLTSFEKPLQPRKRIVVRRCKMEDVPSAMRTFCVAICEQARVLDWPADFLVTVWDESGSKHRAVIECDGHDFHERTKEQAERDRSRDRRLQAEGVRIFRFTGREIHRDASEVAYEVLEWAWNVWVPQR